MKCGDVYDLHLLKKLSIDIHDWWLAHDSIRYDEARKIVTVAVLRPKRENRRPFAQIPPGQGRFVIIELRGVTRLQTDDTAEIVQYPIKAVHFDESRGVLSVTSNIPMVFVAEMSSLNAWVGEG